MMNRITFAALAASAVVGCAGSTTIRSTGPTHVMHASASRSDFAVPAGTQFSVALDRPINTMTSSVGQAFTATLDAPMYASGQLVAPAGAQVYGHVADLQDGRLPLIRLSFDGLETTRGPAPLAVVVRTAEHVAFVDRSRRVNLPPSNWNNGYAAHGAIPSGAHFEDVTGPAVGGSYLGDSFYAGHPNEVRMDAGAHLRLVLTRDLALPVRGYDAR